METNLVNGKWSVLKWIWTTIFTESFYSVTAHREPKQNHWKIPLRSGSSSFQSSWNLVSNAEQMFALDLRVINWRVFETRGFYDPGRSVNWQREGQTLQLPWNVAEWQFPWPPGADFVRRKWCLASVEETWSLYLALLPLPLAPGVFTRPR